MAKLRHATRDLKDFDRRLLTLRLAHALGIHAPMTGLALREGRATPIRWCLICGQQ